MHFKDPLRMYVRTVCLYVWMSACMHNDLYLCLLHTYTDTEESTSLPIRLRHVPLPALPAAPQHGTLLEALARHHARQGVKLVLRTGIDSIGDVNSL